MFILLRACKCLIKTVPDTICQSDNDTWEFSSSFPFQKILLFGSEKSSELSYVSFLFQKSFDF